jgi:hypothetical protein
VADGKPKLQHSGRTKKHVNFYKTMLVWVAFGFSAVIHHFIAHSCFLSSVKHLRMSFPFLGAKPADMEKEKNLNKHLLNGDGPKIDVHEEVNRSSKTKRRSVREE